VRARRGAHSNTPSPPPTLGADAAAKFERLRQVQVLRARDAGLRSALVPVHALIAEFAGAEEARAEALASNGSGAAAAASDPYAAYADDGDAPADLTTRAPPPAVLAPRAVAAAKATSAAKPRGGAPAPAPLASPRNHGGCIEICA
jgi:hypothetical protein